MTTFDFKPTDTLFFRDARPISAGNTFGHGANWPLPITLHGALRTALLRAAKNLPAGKTANKTPRCGQMPGTLGTTAFDWFHIRGPFPVRDGNEILFVAPLDLVRKSVDHPGDRTAKVVNEDRVALAYLHLVDRPRDRTDKAIDNAADFLERFPAGFEEPSKKKFSEWLSHKVYESYLLGEPICAERIDLYNREHRVGVQINPGSHTTVEGQLYGAEHLRLRDDISLRFDVAGRPPHKGDDGMEAGVGVESLAGRILQLGGEQRFGRIEAAPVEMALPRVAKTTSRVKWVLLTPAVFVHGWYPGWVGADGTVKLRVIDKEARRALRRQRQKAGWKYDEASDPAEKIAARLVAARVGKPRVISGWELLADKNGGGRPTRLAVPAGSVFYFEAENPAEAAKLQAALQGRCRSDFFGEKGLGLGVCGSWEHQVRDFGNGTTSKEE